MRTTLRIILATAAVTTPVPALLAPAPAAASGDFGPNTCLVGFVWREAFAGDSVCVAPATRAQARADNAAAASRVDPNGAFGPNTCVSGYVWRAARPSDLVCVTVATRTQARADNAAGASRRNSVVAKLSTWVTSDTGTCRGDTCTTTNDGGIPHHKVVVTNVNVGRTYLGLYRSTGALIAGWYVTASAAPSGVGGVATFKTDRLVCNGAPNAYFRAKDKTSSRWSARQPVRVGCSTL